MKRYLIYLFSVWRWRAKRRTGPAGLPPLGTHEARAQVRAGEAAWARRERWVTAAQLR